MLEHGALGRERARARRARHTDGDGVVHARLRLVDDGGRKLLDAEPGDELSELYGEGRLFHTL